MRMRARAQSVESVRAVRSRKRGRSTVDLLQDPGKLKVVEMRAELKNRGLKTGGVKAVLLDRLLDALEKEQKETSHLVQVEEEQEEAAEMIVIDDEDEIVRESVGSTKSPRSQSLPKATEEKTLTESATEGKLDTSEEGDGASTTGPSSSTTSAALDTGGVASKEASDQNQHHFEENEHSESRRGVEFTTADRAEDLITHDDTWKRKSMQSSGKNELTSPLALKRKSILRKTSSLLPAMRMDRKVSFAPNDEVNMILETSQTDSTQPEPSPEGAPSFPEVHTPREESKQVRSQSPPDTNVEEKAESTPLASSASTTPEDRPNSEKETEEQRRKREFDETVKREAEKLRAATKLSAQKRLEEANASKAFWAKRDQLKAKLRASYADEKRKSAHTPAALSEKPASDQISPSTSEISTAAESNYSAPNSKRPISPALVNDARPPDAVEKTREEALDNNFMRSMARHQEVESISDVSSAIESSLLESKTPRSTYSVVEDKLQAERSMPRRVTNKPTSKSMPLTAGQETESVKLSMASKTANKSDPPVENAVEPATRDRSDSVSSTVSSIPEPSVVENALKSGAATAASTKRKPIANLISGLHSFTTLLEKENPQESSNGRSAPVVNALKLAERSRVAEEKKRLEKEKRKAILKQKMEEHKKAAALKEKAEKDAQAKREQERLNERKKREAELARRRQQKLKEMRAGLEKKRAMLAAEKKSKIAAMALKSTASASQHKHRGLANASDTTQPTAKPIQKPVQKPVPKAPQALASTKSAPVSKLVSKPLTKAVSRPPMTSPVPAKQLPKSHSPEIVNYEMSDNAESSDSSDSDSGRHGKKKVPRWAQRDHLNKILHAQFGKNATNPSPAIFQDFVDTCNLEAIFETTDIRKKKKFARRTSSGNWLADRPTARDKALYQRDMGYDR